MQTRRLVKGRESRVESQTPNCGFRIDFGELSRAADCGLPTAKRAASRIEHPTSNIQPPALSPQPPHHGLTLIELLVVIIILTTVVAAAIPILAPAGADRELREATRGANTYITGAQTRAVAVRRPFGVALKRLAQDTGRAEDNGVCLEMYYVEQQPPYSGFSADSRACVGYLRQVGLATVWYVQFVTPGTTNNDQLPIGWDADLFPGNTIQPGDIIEIGDTRYQFKASEQIRQPGGKTYYFPPNSPGQLMRLEIIPMNDTGQLVNVEYDERGRLLQDGPHSPPANPKRFWTAPLPYRILRQPTKTSDPPYQLPEGTAIDMRASGIGSSTNCRFFHYPTTTTAFSVDSHPRINNAEPVVIMFTPEGRVDHTYYTTGDSTVSAFQLQQVSETQVDNIYLLVGERENVPAPVVTADKTLDSSNSGWTALTADQQRKEVKDQINWLFGLSRWVVIGSQSGRVVSVENAAVDPATMLTASGTPEQRRSLQVLAAREFTFDMANMGGR